MYTINEYVEHKKQLHSFLIAIGKGERRASFHSLVIPEKKTLIAHLLVGEVRSAEGKRPLGRERSGWKDNI